MQAQTIFFLLFSVKLIEYIFPADSIYSDPCLGSLPRVEISFSLLSIFVVELISTPKIIIFLPVPPLGCEKNPCLSNPIPYLENIFTCQRQHF